VTELIQGEWRKSLFKDQSYKNVYTHARTHARPLYTTWGSSSRYSDWREADHSPPSSVEVKNAWSYTSITYTSSWHVA